MIILFNKPFRVLSQFTTDSDKSVLADYIDIPGVYCAGRLDYDSEGLLILTDDGRLQQRIANPAYGKEKGYWVQVEGEPREADLAVLRSGVVLRTVKRARRKWNRSNCRISGRARRLSASERVFRPAG